MSASPLADPQALLGAWELSRVIEDRLAGVQHTVDGTLLLSAESPTRLRWAEAGRWHQEGGDVDVRRDLWLVHDDGAGWWMRFDDGRDFHPWTPGERVVHPCAPDTYCGLVSGSPEGWTVRWDVTGPRKDYTMRTVLTRTT
jgi:hypothetical protein